MAKRSTKKPETAQEKPRAFLFATVTASLISETLAEIERVDRVSPDAAPLANKGADNADDPGPRDER